MTNKFDELKEILNQPNPPSDIWQKPFDYDPGHYKRLFDTTRRPSNNDLCAYMLDYQYMRIQPDLLRFFLPRVLHKWGEYLFDSGEEYGGFAEHFFAALSARPLYPNFLSQDEFDATMKYVASLLLSRMGIEKSLCHSGSKASPYKWLYALCEFMVLFPGLEYLWERWWSLATEPYALCMVQFSSCLLYDESDNPVFSPWTSQEGGGPLDLWGKVGDIIDEETHPKNIAFLKSILSEDYLHGKLTQASERITERDNARILDQILDEFDSRRNKLQEHLTKLQNIWGKI